MVPGPTGTLHVAVDRSTLPSGVQSPPREQRAAARGPASPGRTGDGPSRWHHEEICGHDLSHVIRQERAPGLGRRLPLADHVFRDRGLTHVDPEFQQFAVDPRGAPPRVRGRDASNERADVGRDRRSADPTPTLPAPERAEGAAVPANDGLRFDDDERGAPLGPDIRQPHPQ